MDKKYIEIIKPKQIPSNETFCVLSLWIIKLTRVYIVINILVTLQSIVHMCVWKSFIEIYTTLEVINLILQKSLDLVQMLIVSTQLFEWVTMLYIILTQKNRQTEEILYDHGAENSDNSTDRKDDF